MRGTWLLAVGPEAGHGYIALVLFPGPYLLLSGIQVGVRGLRPRNGAS